jgi:hypothetical protein
MFTNAEILAAAERLLGVSMNPHLGLEWLSNQLGPGNNIPLRLWFHRAVKRGEIKVPLQLVGEQHECFEDTLPDSDT